MATTQPVPPTLPTADDSTALSHIHVLHPTHTKAPLTLAVPSGARVADLKTAISERFPGQPKPNGQRIIWKGRIVVDEEVVGDIWKVGLLFVFPFVHLMLTCGYSLGMEPTRFIWLFIPLHGRPLRPPKNLRPCRPRPRHLLPSRASAHSQVDRCTALS